MRENINKTKVMISGEQQKVMKKAVRWPCGICGSASSPGCPRQSPESHKMVMCMHVCMHACVHACVHECDFNRNYASILYHFQVIASYLSKLACFNLPHLHLAPPLGVTPFKFRLNLGHQKTLGLSCGVVCVILCLAVLTQYQRKMDMHTET